MSPVRLVAWMLGVVVLGVPLVAYLWGTLNDVLALHADPLRVGLAGLVLVILLAGLFRLKRRLQSTEEAP